MEVPVFIPDSEAFAEVAYRTSNKTVWCAKVYRSADGWELRFGKTPAGQFKNGKALRKYVYQKAEEKLGKNPTPIYDSLHKVNKISPQSVVPDCYEPTSSESAMHGGRGLAACVACPYRSQCSEPSAQPKIISAEDVTETEDVFLTRLQAKLKAKYGDKK